MAKVPQATHPLTSNPQLPVSLSASNSTIINIRHPPSTGFKSGYHGTLNDKAATRIQTSSSYREEIKEEVRVVI